MLGRSEDDKIMYPATPAAAPPMTSPTLRSRAAMTVVIRSAPVRQSALLLLVLFRCLPLTVSDHCNHRTSLFGGTGQPTDALSSRHYTQGERSGSVAPHTAPSPNTSFTGASLAPAGFALSKEFAKRVVIAVFCSVEETFDLTLTPTAECRDPRI